MRLIKALLIAIVLISGAMAVEATRDPNLDSGRLSARMAGIADASSASIGTSESIFSNPAALVQIVWPELSTGFGNQDSGDRRLYYLCGSIPVIDGLVAGIGYTSVFFPVNTFEDNRSLQFALAFPLSRNGKLMLGLSGKYVRQYISDLKGSAEGGGIDLGFLYQAFTTSQGQSLQFGMSLIDAQTTLTFRDEDVLLPSVLRFGTYYAIANGMVFSFTFENKNSANDYFDSLQIMRIAIENKWVLSDDFELIGRTGYLRQLNEKGLVTAGIGFVFQDMRLDYAMQLPANMTDAIHLLGLSWGFDKRKKKTAFIQQRIKKQELMKPKEETKKDTFVSALESAAELGDEYSVKKEKPVDVSIKETKATRLVKEKELEEEETYHIPVPIGPAAEENVSLGVSPEMPAAFSGRFGSRKSDGFDIQDQDLRLHVVVNPFSPNNDGRQDRTIFVGRLVTDQLRVAKWILTITHDGEVVRYYKGGSQLPRNLEWDGKDKYNKKLPDGDYIAVLHVMDQYNMELAAASQTVVIRTKPRTFNLVSPGDRVLSGKKNEEPFIFDFPKIPGSSNWKFSILNPRKKMIFQKNGNGQLPESVIWNPMQRESIDAGVYQGIITFVDDVGMDVKVGTLFKIKHAKMDVTLVAQPEIFKPRLKDGTGVQFGIALEGDMKIEKWKLDILEKNQKKVLKVMSGKGKPKSEIDWDGIFEDGSPALGGHVYFGRLTLISVLKTSLIVESQELQCDVGNYTGEKALSINLARVYFAQKNASIDGEAAAVLLKAAETLRKYPTEYTLRVIGYCNKDEMAGNEVTLSRQRADSVADFLIKEAGIPTGKIKAIGKGSQDLIAEGTSSLDKNQRVEVVLFAK